MEDQTGRVIYTFNQLLHEHDYDDFGRRRADHITSIMG
jgi:hypothetical protein